MSARVSSETAIRPRISTSWDRMYFNSVSLIRVSINAGGISPIRFNDATAGRIRDWAGQWFVRGLILFPAGSSPIKNPPPIWRGV